MRGEATPTYAILDAPNVKRIATLFPRLRVVFILRDPIERAWSDRRYRHGTAIRTGRMSIAAMRDSSTVHFRHFERVCNFLGVDAGLLAPSDLTPALNAAPAAPIRPDLQRHLARRYHEPIMRLSNTYGAPPSQWLRSVEAIRHEAAT